MAMSTNWWCHIWTAHACDMCYTCKGEKGILLWLHHQKFVKRRKKYMAISTKWWCHIWTAHACDMWHQCVFMQIAQPPLCSQLILTTAAVYGAAPHYKKKIVVSWMWLTKHTRHFALFLDNCSTHYYENIHIFDRQ